MEYVESSNKNKNIVEWRSAEARKIKKAIDKNAVVIVSRRGCYMAFTVMRLLIMQGVNTFMSEVGDDLGDEQSLMEELGWIGTDIYEEQVVLPIVLPVLVIGGRLVGGMETIMTVHLKGELVPKLKAAGALWL